MVKLSVLYRKTEGAKFDLDYYLHKHMPLVQRTLGAALKGLAVDKGLAGPAPGDAAPYVAIGHLLFDSEEAYRKAMGSAGAELMRDIPNFTTIAPIMQISEVVL